MSELVLTATGLISALGTGFVGWFFGRRKTMAEAVGYEIDNDVKLSSHYKEILDDLKIRYESRYKEFEDMMNRKYKLLEEEIKLKDRKIRLQKQEITELRRENKLLKANANTSLT